MKNRKRKENTLPKTRNTREVIDTVQLKTVMMVGLQMVFEMVYAWNARRLSQNVSKTCWYRVAQWWLDSVTWKSENAKV